MYDYFISHAAADKDRAIRLFDLLAKATQLKVFLDVKCLKPGSHWASEIEKGQESSRCTVALISSYFDRAHFAQEEIIRAIQLSRQEACKHEIIPVYLDGFPKPPQLPPFGLAVIHGIDLPKHGGLENLADFLIHGRKQNKAAYPIEFMPPAEHPLHAFPKGPMLDGHYVQRELIEAIAKTVPLADCIQTVEEANRMRKEADPDDPNTVLIGVIHLIPPQHNTAYQFWLDTVHLARKISPRMLAALLLTIPDDGFSKGALAAKYSLLDALQMV